MNLIERLRDLETIVLYGNDLLLWIAALVVAAVFYAVVKIALQIVAKRLDKVSRKTPTIADDLLFAAVRAVWNVALVIAGLRAGSLLLELPERADRIVHLVFVVALTVQLAVCVQRALGAFSEHYTKTRRETSPGSLPAVRLIFFLSRLLLWSIVFLLVVANLGYDITALIAGLGVGGIAVALAVQNILGDLFASLSIMLDKPFEIGDFIIVGDLMGAVEKIGIKTTRVRSLSGEQLIFSNSDLLASRIRNFKRMAERRVAFQFGVLYQTTAEQLEAIPPLVKEIIEGIDEARFDRAHFKGFGDSSKDFEVVYFVLSPDFNLFMDIQQKINLALCRNFEEQGVDFAYPTRTLYIQHQSGAD